MTELLPDLRPKRKARCTAKQKEFKLEEGVNTATEGFLRQLWVEDREFKARNASISATFEQRPISVDISYSKQKWPLPPVRFGGGGDIVTDSPPSHVTIRARFRFNKDMGGAGSGTIILLGREGGMDVTDRPIPLDGKPRQRDRVPALPMRPLYVTWSISVPDKKGWIAFSQKGKAVVE